MVSLSFSGAGSPVRAPILREIASDDPAEARRRAVRPVDAIASAIQRIHDMRHFQHAGTLYPLEDFSNGSYQNVYRALVRNAEGVLIPSGLLIKAPILERGNPRGLLAEQIAFQERAAAFFPVAPILNAATALTQGALVVPEYRSFKLSDLTDAHRDAIRVLIQRCWEAKFPMDIRLSNFAWRGDGTLCLIDFGPGIEDADEWMGWLNTARDDFADGDPRLHKFYTPGDVQTVETIESSSEFVFEGKTHSLDRVGFSTGEMLYKARGPSTFLLKVPFSDRGCVSQSIREKIAFHKRASQFADVVPILNEERAFAEGVLVIPETRPTSAPELLPHKDRIRALVQKCWDERFFLDLRCLQFTLSPAGTPSLRNPTLFVQARDDFREPEQSWRKDIPQDLSGGDLALAKFYTPTTELDTRASKSPRT